MRASESVTLAVGVALAAEKPLVSSLDDILGDLSRGVSALSARAASAVFAASADALLPAYRAWAGVDDSNERRARIGALQRAIDVGFDLARTGASQADLPKLLRSLESITPDKRLTTPSATAAQDCVVCADLAIRIHVEEGFACGPVIEYALEPVLLAAMQRVPPPTEDSPEDRLAIADALLADPAVMAAVEFLWFAIMRLHTHPEPSLSTIEEMRTRAAVLLPGTASPATSS
jgi:hypothetical protein